MFFLKFFYLALFLLMASFSVAQSFVVEYDTKLIYKLGNADSYVGRLFIMDNNNSYFELDRTTNNGYIVYKTTEIKATKYKYKEYIYKNFSANSLSYIYLHDRNDRKEKYENKEKIQWYELTDTLQPIQWILTGETKEILGLPCQKALGDFKGLRYAAWFTTKVPVSDGPWKFNGLPGLILEVYSSDYKVHITALNIIQNPPKKALDIPPYPPYYKMTLSEYVEKEVNKLKERKMLREATAEKGRSAVVYASYKFFDIEVEY